MKKNLFFSGLIALIVSLSSIGLFTYFSEKGKTVTIEHINTTPSLNAVYTLDKDGNAVPLDFNATAVKVIDGVVHIKSTRLQSNSNAGQRQQAIPDIFEEFFGPGFRFEGPQQQPNWPSPNQVATGSGVIISKDGYIVTNNHVIADADDIEVTLYDNRTYKAAIIGTDPSTDLALLQIKEDNLPTVPLANSDQVQIGQWVMAVGNPMGLNSTVTAGIVSAKGRNINILQDQYAVEDFIQTDAAINPGNSGGALVNLDGGLIGINTAIASPTGTFAGYGFAVPANIVSKVVKDFLEYGQVQRGVLGVMIRTVDGKLAEQKSLAIIQGAYVDSILTNSAAAKAGIKEGDVITAVNDLSIKSSAELQGAIARYRPGEEVSLKLNRKGAEKTLKVILNNRDGNTELASKDTREILRILGAEFETIDDKLADKLQIEGGVKVKRLYAGKISRNTQMREGFIITRVNDQNIRSVDELVTLLENQKGGVMLEGVYEDQPGKQYYAFGM
jgi:Do/DeqQ family serine protease